MTDEAMTCHICGERARLYCAGCSGVFCADHVERRFAMGYFYFCAECLAKQEAAAAARSTKRRTKPPDKS
jgi:hypothetical protein